LDTDIVILPNNMAAIGVIDNSFYFYNIDTPENSNFSENYLDYWSKFIHPFVGSSKYYYILCLWDGYRERIPYCEKFNPFRPTINQFANKIELSNIEPCDQPILHKHKYVFAFCKMVNDENTICIPDRYYIEHHGYSQTRLKEVDDNDIKFEEKKPMCIYRGDINNGSVHNFKEYHNKNGLNQRKYLKKIKDKINYFDFSDDYKNIKEQLQYKYILDVDGHTNTWDATIWKLYSNSVLLKTDSVWKQWYYDDLIPWVHYIPVKNDFSDLNDRIEWCKIHDKECKEIIQNSRKFVIEKLNWDKVQQNTINIFKNYLQSSNQ